MLYCPNKKLIFIHIQKIGGSSTRDMLFSVDRDAKEIGQKHDFARWNYKYIAGWEQCFKVAFVRNPWDRLVSWYSMILQNKDLLSHTRNKLWEYVLEESHDFESFVRNCVDEVDDFDGRKSFVYNQLDYLTDETGRLMVNYVGRYESLEDDIGHIAKRIGLTEKCHVAHVNKSKHDHYSDYYTPELKEIVGQRYQRDIDFFGYTFEAKQGKEVE